MPSVDLGIVEIEGIAIVILFGFLVYLLTEMRLLRKEIRDKQPATPGNSMLPLQAYERLTLFTDRISLKNLVARMHSSLLTVAELQAALIETVRTEYEHNITQQNYINPEVWKAITKMKDQNLFIISQLAASLHPQAPAIELSRSMLEYGANDNSELGPVVLDAIQYEVKRLM